MPKEQLSDAQAANRWRQLAELVNEGRGIEFVHQQQEVPNPASASGRPRRENTGVIACTLRGLPTERHIAGNGSRWSALGRTMVEALDATLHQRQTAYERFQRNAPPPTDEEEEGDPPSDEELRGMARGQQFPEWQVELSAHIREGENERCGNCHHASTRHRVTQTTDGVRTITCGGVEGRRCLCVCRYVEPNTGIGLFRNTAEPTPTPVQRPMWQVNLHSRIRLGVQGACDNCGHDSSRHVLEPNNTVTCRGIRDNQSVACHCRSIYQQ